jgi:hypothetical protein
MLGGTATATGGIVGIPGGPGFVITTNANSFATTINGNMAQALSSAVSVAGTHGQAQATAQTNFGNFQSVQSTSTSPVSGPTTTASAFAQAGGVVSLSNPIIPGQSFSVVSGSGFGPLTEMVPWAQARRRVADLSGSRYFHTNWRRLCA